MAGALLGRIEHGSAYQFRTLITGHRTLPYAGLQAHCAASRRGAIRRIRVASWTT